jgi:fructosamine-3-kinase
VWEKPVWEEPVWEKIAAEISRVTERAFHPNHHRSVGGGSINQAYCLSEGDRAYFVKLNRAEQGAMFQAEALGLQQIFDSKTIRVPKPICWGTVGSSAYLVLEWLNLGYGDPQAWEAMGRNLAAMHRVTSSKGFGWDQDNTIGSTPQINTWTENWIDFFLEHRLSYQFRLAHQQGGRFPQQERLLNAVPELLAGHSVQPALVHGDLWTGNAAVTNTGEPVIVDPATYFGDREVDIAMSQLFGSFPSNFYSAYHAAFPLEAGYQRRKTLYNLYHIINHFNLFGGSYEYQANQMIASLL